MSMLQELGARTEEALTVKRVFGEPYAKNGTTIIPVAAVNGGFGSGEGPTTRDPATGEPTVAGRGGGSMLRARPSGVYVVKGDDVRWLPALDINRIVAGMQLVAIVALLTVRSFVRARARGTA